MSLGLPTDSSPAADIVFRYLQRLSIALADRLDWLMPDTDQDGVDSEATTLRSPPQSFLSAAGIQRHTLRVSGPGQLRVSWQQTEKDGPPWSSPRRQVELPLNRCRFRLLRPGVDGTILDGRKNGRNSGP